MRIIRVSELTIHNIFNDVDLLYTCVSLAYPFTPTLYAKRVTHTVPIFPENIHVCVPWLRDLLEVYMTAKTRATSAGPATQSCLHCPGNQRRRSLQVGNTKAVFPSLDAALRVTLETHSYFPSSSFTPSFVAFPR